MPPIWYWHLKGAAPLTRLGCPVDSTKVALGGAWDLKDEVLKKYRVRWRGEYYKELDFTAQEAQNKHRAALTEAATTTQYPASHHFPCPFSAMKPSVLSFLVPLLGVIVPVAQANFDIYHHFISNPFGTSYDSWKIFATDPTCAQTDSTPTWFDENDVSKRMLGVVCEGTCGGLQRADGITRLEMHFSNNPLYHWSECF